MTGRGLSVAIGAAVAVGLLVVRRRYLVITVNGASMLPTFTEGDRVLVRRGSVPLPSRGDVVVLRTPPSPTGWNGPPSSTGPARRGWSIKRVVAVPGDPLPETAADACGGPAGTPVPAGRLVVFGDALDSYDSRTWGFLPTEQLIGVVTRRLTSRSDPPRRAGSDRVAIR
ncbi:S26 family signal peptidase [Nonomuraea sp. MCN248]|uniref:S26 family signal peptidase n=1 Tax=Nonomuraea corallina TaxID=2989783 RepID=A0ABT4SK99_9ACTN|nr:S26 family signal peptidase [Nonomuraea corallina]MDA0637658.1 S26 family signal peptidase [Nonomuraea corallina]